MQKRRRKTLGQRLAAILIPTAIAAVFIAIAIFVGSYLGIFETLFGASPTPTLAPTSAHTPTAAPSEVLTPTLAPTATDTPTPTDTPTSAPTSTPTETPTPSPTPSPEPTPTDMPTPTPVGNGKKRVALTFDDGPNGSVTGRLLDILAEHNAKATFFVVGERVSSHKKVLKRAYDEGHQIGSHSYSHQYFTKISDDEILKEIRDSLDAIESVIGVRPTILRLPGGSSNSHIMSILKDEGLPSIRWNVDPEDWKYRDSEIVAEHILSHISSGSIILLHDLYKTSVDAIEIVLNELEGSDYEFVTIDELFPDIQAGKTYYSTRNIK